MWTRGANSCRDSTSMYASRSFPRPLRFIGGTSSLGSRSSHGGAAAEAAASAASKKWGALPPVSPMGSGRKRSGSAGESRLVAKHMRRPGSEPIAAWSGRVKGMSPPLTQSSTKGVAGALAAAAADAKPAAKPSRYGLKTHTTDGGPAASAAKIARPKPVATSNASAARRSRYRGR
eukprot:938019-Prymnesium_polylepis.1